MIAFRPTKKGYKIDYVQWGRSIYEVVFDVVLKTAKETSDIWKGFVKSPRNLRCKNSQIQLHNDLAPLYYVADRRKTLKINSLFFHSTWCRCCCHIPCDVVHFSQMSITMGPKSFWIRIFLLRKFICYLITSLSPLWVCFLSSFTFSKRCLSL